MASMATSMRMRAMASRAAYRQTVSVAAVSRRDWMVGTALALSPLLKPMSAAAAGDEGFTTAKNGLQFKDVQVGDGPAPVKGARIQCHYTGRLKSNGQKFDSSYDRRQPLAFQIGVGQVIKGWDQGILGSEENGIPAMKEGGKRILIIPAELGYGARGAGGVIPPNAVLEFDVELLPRNAGPVGWLQEQVTKGMERVRKMGSWLDAV